MAAHEPTTLIILGASGDLTRRLLLPGLGTLLAADPQRRVRVWGSARNDLDDWSQTLQEALSEGGAPADAIAPIVGETRYLPLDITDGRELDRLLDAVPDLDHAVLYFALPPAVTVTVCQLLADRRIGGLRLALEKPFGTDLESARELNRLLATFREEEQVFRVDHFLGEAQVLNLLGLRFANAIFQPVWDAKYIERVDIVADETLALEGRAGYYDGTGALIDMLQSHLLLVMSLVAIERPARVEAAELRELMAEALRATRLAGDPFAASRRARYTAGTVDGQDVPAYVDEPGVDPSRATETLAELDLLVDTDRWAGVPFRLRSGKALGVQDWRIDLHFAPTRDVPEGLGGRAPAERLTMHLSPDVIDVRIATNGGGDKFRLESTHLTAKLSDSPVRPYGEILAKILDGDPLLSVRGDVSQECWRICDPVLAAWRAGQVPLQEYPAGSQGPHGWSGSQQPESTSTKG